MSRISTEYMYLYALVEEDNPWRSRLEGSYGHLLRVIKGYIDAKTCPFCKRRFKKVVSVKYHLRRSSCAVAMRGVIKMLRRHVPEDEVLAVIEGRVAAVAR